MDDMKKPQNIPPVDTPEEEMLLKSCAEALAITEQTELEMAAMHDPEPQYSEEYWKNMNAVAEQLNREGTPLAEEPTAPAAADEPDVGAEETKNATSRQPLFKTKRKRVLAIAIAVAAIASVPIVAAASGVKFLTLFSDRNAKSMNVYYSSDDEAALQEAYHLSGLPEGYAVIDQNTSDTVIETVYGSVHDSLLPRIILQQYNSSPDIMFADQEDLTEQVVDIQGATGHCYYHDGKTVIVWEMDDRTFALVSTLPVEELEVIANSIRR